MIRRSRRSATASVTVRGFASRAVTDVVLRCDPDKVDDRPVLTFLPDGLNRPPVEVLDAMIYALWESRFAPHDQRIRGVIAAGQWLAQVRQHGPVSGEDRAPVWQAVVDENTAAIAVAFGLPHAHRGVDPAWAQGVADMLDYAMGAAEVPVPLVPVDPEVPVPLVPVPLPEAPCAPG